MKRKSFSKLLMVALVIASVSSFVSCKDYDDDINNLQKQIDAKAAITQIETLQSQLASAQSAAQAAQADATKALADAAAAAKTAGDAATAKALEDAIAKVNAAAEKAATENAAAIKAAADAAKAAGDDAAAAKTAADEAKAAAEKAAADAQKAIKDAIDALVIPTMPDLSGYATKSEVLTEAQIKALISQNAQAKGEYVTATSLATQLDELKKTIPGAVDLTEINNAIASYDGAISALYSAVTSVELIGSYSASSDMNLGQRLNDDTWFGGPRPMEMTLTHGTVGENSVFGDNEAWREAAPTVTYTEGADIKFEQGLVVRVNPVTADLTNAKILLVNSKGEAIDDYVVAGTPTRYNKLISTTRASSVNSGLWIIPFEMAKSGVTAKDFYDNVSRTGYRYDALGNLIAAGTRILYAVAVNNTFDASEDRYAVSSYDVATTYNPYVAARTFTYHVDDVMLENIRNRWDGAKTQAEQANANTYLEQIWQVSDALAASPKHITPATAIVTTPAANKNVLDATMANAIAVGGGAKLRDARAMGIANPLPVEIGVPFTIDNIAAYTTEAGYEADATFAYTNADTKVEWYYVVLDKTHAIESIPSEENAWLSYDITGLNTMTKATEALDITINSASAKGDIIGFRVYAVNYDGTLADPDGRAFYVCPGDPANVNAVNVPYTATLNGFTGVAVSAAGIKAGANNKSDFVEIPSDMTFTDANGVAFAPAGSSTILAANFPTYLGGNIIVRWALYKDAAGRNAATKWSEVKYIKIVVDNPQNQVDNSTVSFTINGLADAAHGNAVVNSLRVNVTKELPNSKNTNIVWRTSLEPDANNVLTVYPLAAQSAGVATAAIANVKWPAAGSSRAASWNVATPNIKYASVDLAGYANDLNAADTYWEVSNVKQDGTAKTVKVLGAVAADVEAADVFDNFVLKMDKAMIGQTVDAVIKSNYKNISAPTLAETGAAAKDVPFTAWTGKIKFEDGIEKLLKLEATSYIQNYKNATTTQDDKTPAKSNAYYYFWKDGDVTPIKPAPLWGNITTAGYTLDNALMKWIDGNATWTDASKTVAYTTAPAAFVTATKVYEYEKIFTPVWGVRTNAADLKRQVLAEYVGLYDVTANNFPVNTATAAPYTLSNYLKFKKPTLSETAPAVKAATTLVEAVNYSVGGVVTGFQIQNQVGNVPTADVTCKLKIQGEDIFGYKINDDNLSMSFIIKPLKKTDY